MRRLQKTRSLSSLRSLMQHIVLTLGLLLAIDGNLTLPAFATESEQRFDDLAYLEFRVGEIMAPRCSERFPEYRE